MTRRPPASAGSPRGAIRRGWVCAGALATLLALAPPPPAAAQTDTTRATVTGQVRGRFDGRVRPLAYAVVEAEGPGVRRSTVADSLGHYELRGLPAGAFRVRAVQTGHDPVWVDVILPAGDTMVLDLELSARPVELPELDVGGDRRTPDGPPGAGERNPELDGGSRLTEVDILALEGPSALGTSGIVEAVAGIPGNDPADATDVLFMRGSTTDLKLVLLDGAPVYTPFHVAGILRTFEPAVLGRADLHTGGAPARYDGGLTSILDLQTRRPERDGVRGSGSLDLLSASAALEGPLGRDAGFLASLRSLHELGSAPLGASPYGYTDALVSAEADVGRGHVLRTTAFWNRESVVLDLPATVGPGAAAAPDDASWSNRAVSGVYTGRMGDAFVEATVAAGAYDATLPLQPSPPPGEPLPDPLLAAAHNRRIRAGLDVARAFRGTSLRAGLSFEDLSGRYGAGPVTEGPPPANTLATASSAGAYVDGSTLLGPEVVLRAGLRLDRLSGTGGGLRLAPRAAVTWSLAPTALLTVAAGRYHQHARSSDAEVERSLTDVVVDGATAASLLPVATADHVVVSLEQRLGDHTRLGIEGFWKSFEGLRPDSSQQPIRSSGMDLRVQRRGEAFTAWMGYGLSWFWSNADLSGTASEFAGRHLLSAGLAGHVAGRFGAEARIAYGAGLPYTALPFRATSDAVSDPTAPGREELEALEPPLQAALDDPFLRLDLEVYMRLAPQWGGRTWQVRPYLRILNALDRRDALFYAFQPWRSEGLTPLAERSVVPVFGVAWRF